VEAKDSVALCHQLRVLDGARLLKKLGEVTKETLSEIESVVMFTTGIV
jgi:mRNA interferase MazF